MSAETPPSVILLMTHFVNADIFREYRKLRNETGPGYAVVLLYNVTGLRHLPEIPEDIEVCRFTQADLDHGQYPRKPAVLSSYNVDLFPLHFARCHPQYRHYWVVEYDVRFSGCWDTLFGHFGHNAADLLGTTLYRYDVDPTWENWASVVTPDGRGARRDWVRGFFPICRLSSAAIAALDQAYRQGWGGHFEATVPTILKLAGLALEDIGGTGEFVAPGNRNRFYDNTRTDPNLAPGSFIYRPVRTEPGLRPDRLWHPVRPLSTESWALGRREKLVRNARAWLRNGLGALGLTPAGR